MNIRKTYILVKVPTSVPERAEPVMKRSVFTERKQQRHSSPISLEKKIEPCKSKFWIKEFPINQSLTSEKRVHGRSYSVVKHSPSPVKLKRYVESILDKKLIKSQKSYKKTYSSLSYVKGVCSSPPKHMYIRSKLVPMFKNRLW